MGEYTPGPWRLEVEADALHVYSPREEILHFSDAGWDEFTRATYEANARLIAAAPDLLAALEAVLRTTDINALAGSGWTQSPAAPPNILKIAYAAIAKATGKEA